MPRLRLKNFGTALAFNGTSAKVTTASVFNTAVNNFTLSIWFKTNDPKQQRQVLMTNGTSTGISGYALTVNRDNTNYGLYLLAHQVAWNGITTVPIDTRWHQLTVTLSSANLMIGYLDGVQVVSATITVPGTPASFGAIGAENNANGGWFNGNLDEARMWTRVLTPNEVSSLYSKGIVPSSGLVSEYKLNEGTGSTVIDTGSNSLNATNTNATYTTDVPVRHRTLSRDFGTSLMFSGGSSQYARSATFANKPTFNVSAAVWYKPTSISNAFSGIMYQANSNTDYQWSIGTGSDSSIIYVNIQNDAAGNYQNFTSGLKVGDWYHIGFVWDGTTVRHYLNGVLKASNSFAGVALKSINPPFNIGRIENGFYLSAILDEALAWNRALTSAEFTDLYNSGIIPNSGLVGKWLFNEGNGSTAVDDTANNNLTLNNSPAYSSDTPMRSR